MTSGRLLPTRARWPGAARARLAGAAPTSRSAGRRGVGVALLARSAAERRNSGNQCDEHQRGSATASHGGQNTLRHPGDQPQIFAGKWASPRRAFRGAIRAGTDTTADVLGDGGDDGTNGDGGTRPYVYLAMASTALMPNVVYPTDIVMVDVAAQRATLDTTLIGIRAMAYHDGKLFVARGAGYTRVSILNAETLAVERTQVLPRDPTAAVFSSDCAYLYAAHGDGYVAQVRMADGAVTADVLVPLIGPLDSSVNNAIFDLTISPSQTLLGTTTFYSGDGSGVGLNAIAGETLALAHQWMSPQFGTSNCSPVAASQIAPCQ